MHAWSASFGAGGGGSGAQVLDVLRKRLLKQRGGCLRDVSGVRCREARHLLSCHVLAVGGVRLRGQSCARVVPAVFNDAVFNC
jgi:hypothetical protein